MLEESDTMMQNLRIQSQKKTFHFQLKLFNHVKICLFLILNLQTIFTLLYHCARAAFFNLKAMDRGNHVTILCQATFPIH